MRPSKVITTSPHPSKRGSWTSIRQGRLKGTASPIPVPGDSAGNEPDETGAKITDAQKSEIEAQKEAREADPPATWTPTTKRLNKEAVAALVEARKKEFASSAKMICDVLPRCEDRSNALVKAHRANDSREAIARRLINLL